MDLTLLRVDFFHTDWSARCCELRSRVDPFRIQTGDYRPLPVGARGAEIGAETIFGDGWTLRLDSSCDPVDHWIARSADRVEFEVAYFGVTPPLAGVGAYNLVLPPDWWFADIRVSNPYGYGPRCEFGRDEGRNREAVMLYFEGPNSRFEIRAQAAHEAQVKRVGQLEENFFALPRNIVEPQAGNAG